jgi:hypothetical protein
LAALDEALAEIAAPATVATPIMAAAGMRFLSP